MILYLLGMLVEGCFGGKKHGAGEIWLQLSPKLNVTSCIFWFAGIK